MPVRKPLRLLSVALNNWVNLSFDGCGTAHSAVLKGIQMKYLFTERVVVVTLTVSLELMALSPRKTLNDWHGHFEEELE